MVQVKSLQFKYYDSSVRSPAPAPTAAATQRTPGRQIAQQAGFIPPERASAPRTVRQRLEFDAPVGGPPLENSGNGVAEAGPRGSSSLINRPADLAPLVRQQPEVEGRGVSRASMASSAAELSTQGLGNMTGGVAVPCDSAMESPTRIRIRSLMKVRTQSDLAFVT